MGRAKGPKAPAPEGVLAPIDTNVALPGVAGRLGALEEQMKAMKSQIDAHVTATHTEMTALKTDIMSSVELSALIRTESVRSLTEPETLVSLKRGLGLFDKEDDAEVTTKKRKRRDQKKDHQGDFEQLIHHYFHSLLRKSHARPSHWSELQAIPSTPGTTKYWPKPVLDADAQPVSMLVGRVIQEDAHIASAIKDDCDIDWATLPPAPSRPSGDAAEQTPSTKRVDRTLDVWRPNWSDRSASSWMNFCDEVHNLCKELLNTEAYRSTRPYDADDMKTYIEAYWTNVSLQYDIQLSAVKREERDAANRRDRRRLRDDRIRDARWFNFDQSPLFGLKNHQRLKLGLCHKHSPTSEPLSDDEEERFVKREKFDERKLYWLLAANSRDAKYNKQAMWEARDPFWMTYECKAASIVLDQFCMKKGATPVFRTPWNLLQKDWQHVKWPKIRPYDAKFQPIEKGEGLVIYRFMVNHEAMKKLPGYDDWQKQLYPDPVFEDEVASLPIDTDDRHWPTLDERCNDPAFKVHDLVNYLDRAFRQATKRQPEDVLEKQYEKIMAERAPGSSSRIRDHGMTFY